MDRARSHPAQGRAVAARRGPPQRRAPPVRRPAPAPGRRAELHHLLHARPRRLVLRRQPRAPGGAARDPGLEPPPGRHRATGRHRPHRRRRPARPGRVGQEPRRAPLRRGRDRRRPGAVLRRAVGPGGALRGRLPLGGAPRARGSRAGWAGPSGCSSSCEQLHPTPAVGGTPRAEALAFIGGPRGGRAGALGRAGGLGRRRRRRGVDDRHPQRRARRRRDDAHAARRWRASWPVRTPAPRPPRPT